MKILRYGFYGLTIAMLFACGAPTTTTRKVDSSLTQSSAAQAQALAEQHGWSSTTTAAPRNTLVYFAFDRTQVDPSFQAGIATQAKYLVAHPQATVRIAGHTDSRGSREYNMGLGWRRARAVVDVLQSMGVLRQQIDTQSFGAEKPMVLGQNENAYRQNRRVALTYEASQ